MATAPGMYRAILTGLRAPVTARTLGDLQAWQRAEGGSATYNPFNTTQGGFGGSSYNSVGVKSFPTQNAGTRATLATLNNGRYGSIIGSLRSGGDPAAFSSAISASPWGTSGSLVAKILGQKPPTTSLNYDKPLSVHNTKAANMAPPNSNKLIANFLLKNSQSLLSGGWGASPVGLMNALAQPSTGSSNGRTLGSDPGSGGSTPSPVAIHKGELALPAQYKATHGTGGLAGFPAIDNFASAGAQVLAPVGGKLTYVHMIPWNEQKHTGGMTAYLQGTNGKTYFLTHFGKLIPAGNVTAGQALGTVAQVPNGWWPSHIHEGVYNGIYNPPGA